MSGRARPGRPARRASEIASSASDFRAISRSATPPFSRLQMPKRPRRRASSSWYSSSRKTHRPAGARGYRAPKRAERFPASRRRTAFGSDPARWENSRRSRNSSSPATGCRARERRRIRREDSSSVAAAPRGVTDLDRVVPHHDRARHEVADPLCPRVNRDEEHPTRRKRSTGSRQVPGGGVGKRHRVPGVPNHPDAHPALAGGLAPAKPFETGEVPRQTTA